jgi:hypothetical protein
MIQRFTGVLLDVDEARYLAGALDHLCKVLRDNGQRPRPRLESLQAKLSTAIAVQTNSGNGSCAEGSGENSDDLGHVLGTRDAARILAVSPNGARDLARRGKIRARFTGTRWFYSAADVECYAEARAERRQE